MIHQIFKLQCCDGISPYNDYGQKTDQSSDCMLRSMNICNLTSNSINFGMVFQARADFFNYRFPLEGFVGQFGYHVWTESEDTLFESCRQWKSVFGEELDTDQLVMMFDLSHWKMPKTLAGAKLLVKDMVKKLKFAKSKGIKLVYFSGITFDYGMVKEGCLSQWRDWDWFNKEADDVEYALEKYFKGEEVPQLFN